MNPHIVSSMFVLPHLLNMLPLETAKKVLAATDALFTRIPLLGSQGGQLVITLTKTG